MQVPAPPALTLAQQQVVQHVQLALEGCAAPRCPVPWLESLLPPHLATCLQPQALALVLAQVQALAQARVQALPRVQALAPAPARVQARGPPPQALPLEQQQVALPCC